MTDYEFFKQLKQLDAKIEVTNVQNDVTLVELETFIPIITEYITNLNPNVLYFNLYSKCFDYIKAFGIYSFKHNNLNYNIKISSIYEDNYENCRKTTKRYINHIESLFKELNIIPNFSVYNCAVDLAFLLETILNPDEMLQEITTAIINKNRLEIFGVTFPNMTFKLFNFSFDGNYCKYNQRNAEFQLRFFNLRGLKE